MSEPYDVMTDPAIRWEPPSDARDPKDRVEETLHFAARPVLEDVRRKRGTRAMMEALNPIAKFYGVDKETLLDLWTHHDGPTLIYEATGRFVL